MLIPTLSTLAEEAPEMTGSYITAVTITGLVVVFLGLVILVFFLKFMGTIFTTKKPKAVPAAKTDAAKLQKPKPVPTTVEKPVAAPVVTPAEDSDEIIAVIAAAVAAMSAADQTTYKISKITPSVVSDNRRSAWIHAARQSSVMPF